MTANQSMAGSGPLLGYVNSPKGSAGPGAPVVVISVDPAFADRFTNLFGDSTFNQAIQALGGVGYPNIPTGTTPGYSGALIVGVPGWGRGDGYQSANPNYVAPQSLTGVFAQDQTRNNLYVYRRVPTSSTRRPTAGPGPTTPARCRSPATPTP